MTKRIAKEWTDDNGVRVRRHTYPTLDSYIEAAEHALNDLEDHEADYLRDMRPDWAGDGARWDECVKLARNGWPKGVQEALPIAEQALETIEQEQETLEFQGVYGMAGSEVDVGRYVQGIPENMVEYELIPTSKVGRVVTLCANLCVSGAIQVESLLRRGAAITALAMALERAGHETEIYVDIATQYDRTNTHRAETRIVVKSAHDTVDADRIAFALAHPSMLRRFWFAEGTSFPEAWKDANNMYPNGGYGHPVQGTKDLPEGTIYMPALKSGRDIEDPERFIFDKLRDLGLLREDQT